MGIAIETLTMLKVLLLSWAMMGHLNDPSVQGALQAKYDAIDAAYASGQTSAFAVFAMPSAL